MRFALATVALAAASASASTLFGRQSIPACAGKCIASANLGGCAATDNACLCRSQAFLSTAIPCVEMTCTGSDLAEAKNAAEQLCLAVGVTLTAVLGSATAAASETGASSTASGSAAAVTTPAPSSSIAASSAGSSTSSSAPAATSSSKSAGSIVGVNAFAGMAAFGLAALAL
ncbi:hypothetical protein K443DRAFT_515923 [Laccaria amethystina LaAM-08-1]|uniref:CFEM domain-containing protein n=1 Tax=Laccaria amethystina LaAM-08-1 TaxID=1095629 RepID=A0A0C9XCI0_9AGAR|nr:hypothetical protein K443DRAFT_515923 [Laccaria amethystina LaAM-08-1]